MNISQTKHKKVWQIGITNTKDVGSGVHTIVVYAQALDSQFSYTQDASGAVTSNANLDNAVEIARIIDVDHTPSACSDKNIAGYANIVLRDENGNAVNNPDDAKHGPNHVYPIDFDTYISGKYYAFWAFGIDKAGNMENVAEEGEVNSKKIPLIYSTQPLIDSIPPEFEDLEQLNDLVYDATGYESGGKTFHYYIITDTDRSEDIEQHIIYFEYGTAHYNKYVLDTAYDSTTQKLWVEINTDGIGANSAKANTTYLLPEVKAVGQIGAIELELPISNSTNFKAYKIERSCKNLKTEPATYYTTAEQVTSWEKVGYINAEKYTDQKLILDVAHLTTDDPAKTNFLYKITPISLYKDADGNEIAGKPTFLASNSNVNLTNYRPSAGKAPNTDNMTVSTSSKDGKITVTWTQASDTNGDLRGYNVFKKIQTNVDGDQTTEETEAFWLTFIDKDKVNSDNKLVIVDADVEPYQPNQTKYAYGIQPVDWAGNAPDPLWTTYIAATKSSIANNPTVHSATGLIGGWKGQVSYSDEEEIIYIDVWGREALTISDVSSATPQKVARIAVHPDETSAEFTWMAAPAGESHYAQFKVQATDKWGNISLESAWGPSVAAKSLTPQAVIDTFAPSVLGFTVTPSIIPESDITVKITSSGTDATQGDYYYVETTKNSDGSYVSFAAGSLSGKNLINTINGEVITINNNNVTNAGTHKTQIFVNSHFTSDDAADTIVEIEPQHVLVSIDKTDELGKPDATTGLPTKFIKANAISEDLKTISSIKDYTDEDNNGAYIINLNDTAIQDLTVADHIYDGWTLVIGQLTLDANNNVTGYTVLETKTITNYSGNVIEVTEPVVTDIVDEGDENGNATTHIVLSFQLTDVSGYNLYKTKVINGENSGWQFVTDTKDDYSNAGAFTVIDTALESGEFKYGITAYDLNNNETQIKSSTSSVNIEDTVAPGVPEVKNVVGGSGSLTVTWNRTSRDISHYNIMLKVIKSDGTTKYITKPDDASTNDSDHLVQIKSETATFYGITLPKSDILNTTDDTKGLFYIVVAVDTSGNSISLGARKVDTDWIFLDNYTPADGNAPSAPTISPSIEPDHDGKVKITLSLEGHGSDVIDIRSRYVNLYAQYTDHNTGAIGDVILLQTIPVPALDKDNKYVSDITYKDTVNKLVSASYWITTIDIDGDESSAGPTSTTNVTDIKGPVLIDTEINAIFKVETGKVSIYFNDTIDLNSAKYEIWRTPKVDTLWSQTNFFLDTGDTPSYQPRRINSYWERIATIASTKDNDISEDQITYNDNDWQPNGTIDPEDTSLLMPYTGQACYAIVGIDRWGNRGDVIFVSSEPQNDGLFSQTKSIVTLPYEPRIYNVKEGAIFFNFNESVQATRGDVPFGNIDATLFPGKGIQVNGNLKYNLNNLNDTYSIALTKLEKYLNTTEDFKLEDIVDIYIYDTTKDTINSDWRFDTTKSWYTEPFSETRGGSKEFPEIALLVATKSHVYIFNYETGDTWMRFDKDSWTYLSPTNRKMSSIMGLNGIIYYSQDFNGSNGFIGWINFIQDNAYDLVQKSLYRQYTKPIIERNTTEELWEDAGNMTLSGENSFDIKAIDINNKDYIIVATESGISVLNPTDDISIHSKDHSTFTRIAVQNDYIYALKENDTAIYRSTKKIQEMDWSVNGAEVIELEQIALPSKISGEKYLEFDKDNQQYLYVQDNAIKIDNNFSILIFFRTSTDVVSHNVILTTSYLDDNNGYKGFGVFVVNNLVYVKFKDGTNYRSLDYKIASNTNYALVLKVLENNRFELFLNGILVDTFEDSSFNSFLSQYFWIGANPAPTYRYFSNNKYVKIAVFNYALPDRKIQEYSFGRELYDEDKWGRVLNSGTLTIGEVYTIVDYQSGDDFTNVGADSNANGVEFVATGTTPATWTNGTIVIRKGCVAEWKADNYNATTLKNGTAITNGASGNLYTTEFIEGDDPDANNDTLKATQSDSSKQPTLKELPVKYNLFNGSEELIRAYRFDGEDDGVQIGNSINFKQNKNSFSFYLVGKPQIPSLAWSKVIGVYGNSSIKYYLEWNGSAWSVYISDGSNHTSVAFANDKFTSKNSLFIANIDRKNKLLNVYVNNKLVGSSDITSIGDLNPDLYFFVGKYIDNYEVAGTFYRAGMFNKVLDDAERETLWNNGSPETAVIPYELQGAKNSVQTDGGMEGTISDSWSVLGGNILATETIIVHNGSQSAKVTAVDTNALLVGKGGVNDWSTYGGKIGRYARMKAWVYVSSGWSSGNIVLNDSAASSSYTVVKQWTQGTDPTDTWTEIESIVEITNLGTTAPRVRAMGTITNGDIVYIDDITIDLIGNVLDLKPENIHPAIWKDASGNGLDAVTYGSPEVITNEPLPKALVSNDDKVVVGFKSELEMDYRDNPGDREIKGKGGLIILEE